MRVRYDFFTGKTVPVNTPRRIRPPRDAEYKILQGIVRDLWQHRAVSAIAAIAGDKLSRPVSHREIWNARQALDGKQD